MPRGPVFGVRGRGPEARGPDPGPRALGTMVGLSTANGRPTRASMQPPDTPMMQPKARVMPQKSDSLELPDFGDKVVGTAAMILLANVTPHRLCVWGNVTPQCLFFRPRTYRGVTSRPGCCHMQDLVAENGLQLLAPERTEALHAAAFSPTRNLSGGCWRPVDFLGGRGAALAGAVTQTDGLHHGYGWGQHTGTGTWANGS